MAPSKLKESWHTAAGHVLHYVMLPVRLAHYIRDQTRRTLPLSAHEWERKRRIEDEAYYRKQRHEDKPVGLPTTRARALTLPLPLDLTKPQNSPFEQHTADQSKCSLLDKLPLELRLKIWELVVAGHTIAVFPGRGRLLHQFYDDDDALHTNAAYLWYHYPTRYYPTSLSSLLKTCRQVYVISTEKEMTALLMSKQVLGSNWNRLL